MDAIGRAVLTQSVLCQEQPSAEHRARLEPGLRVRWAGVPRPNPRHGRLSSCWSALAGPIALVLYPLVNHVTIAEL